MIQSNCPIRQVCWTITCLTEITTCPSHVLVSIPVQRGKHLLVVEHVQWNIHQCDHVARPHSLMGLWIMIKTCRNEWHKVALYTPIYITATVNNCIVYMHQVLWFQRYMFSQATVVQTAVRGSLLETYRTWLNRFSELTTSLPLSIVYTERTECLFSPQQSQGMFPDNVAKPLYWNTTWTCNVLKHHFLRTCSL